MKYNELNNYILNYIEKDKTGRAIMLTSEWGAGKSYYLKNKLKPFLESKENGEHKCVFVSLYGLTDISEISKAIYMELRTVKTGDSEGANTTKVVAKIIGKTVFNGLISKIGFDIGEVSEDDIRKVYESIDLTDKLVIFEDVERSQINIISLLGYINNMCENEGIKVLLVANENELIHVKYCDKKVSEYGKEKQIIEKVYSEDSINYLKAKEKTISDTIVFYANIQETIDNIISQFENDDLSKFKGCIKATNRSFYKKNMTNFREVIVACQKSCDIYEYLKEHDIEADDEFKKCIFIGLVNYLQKRLDNPDLIYERSKMFSGELSGDELYPLIRFCYDYYKSQTIDASEVNAAINQYKEYILYVDKNYNDDPDLSVLYREYSHTEKKINHAITSIFYRLDNIGDISLNHYDRIINHLLIFKYDYLSNNDKIDGVIEKIINNLKGHGKNFTQKEKLFTITSSIDSEKGQKEFDEIKKRVFESLNYSPNIFESDDFSDYNLIIPKIEAEDVVNKDPNYFLEKMQFDKLVANIQEIEPGVLNHLDYLIQNIGYSKLNKSGIELLLKFKQDVIAILKEENNSLDIIIKGHLNHICRSIDFCIQIQY